MKRLLFYTKVNFANASNVAFRQKVLAQCLGFEAHDVECRLWGMEDNQLFLEQTDGVKKIWDFGKNSLKKLFFQYYGFLDAIDIREYDVIYIRHFLVQPLFLGLLWRMKRQNPRLKIILEIPTFPYVYSFKHANWKQKLQLWIDQRCAPFFQYFIDLVVTYAAEHLTKIYNIPSICIENGIETRFFSPNPAPPYSDTLHLIGVANVQPWHGFDRLLRSLAHYYQTNNDAKTIVFHIVGQGPSLEELKELTTAFNLEKNVIFHGATFGKKLDKLFNISHLGIGVLGMCRTDLTTVSSLKAREYAVRGLPFVQDCPDDSFPSDFPFLHWVPMDETLISISNLIEFYENLRQKHSDYPTKLHHFAEENLTWAKQLQKVIPFF